MTNKNGLCRNYQIVRRNPKNNEIEHEVRHNSQYIKQCPESWGWRHPTGWRAFLKDVGFLDVRPHQQVLRAQRMCPPPRSNKISGSQSLWRRVHFANWWTLIQVQVYSRNWHIKCASLHDARDLVSDAGENSKIIYARHMRIVYCDRWCTSTVITSNIYCTHVQPARTGKMLQVRKCDFTQLRELHVLPHWRRVLSQIRHQHFNA